MLRLPACIPQHKPPRKKDMDLVKADTRTSGSNYLFHDASHSFSPSSSGNPKSVQPNKFQFTSTLKSKVAVFNGSCVTLRVLRCCGSTSRCDTVHVSSKLPKRVHVYTWGLEGFQRTCVRAQVYTSYIATWTLWDCVLHSVPSEPWIQEIVLFFFCCFPAITWVR